jgi:RNA polymerase sigma-70 factor (ECF subfamily)
MEAAYNLAFWLSRSRSDAEDIVQDAYLRAFRGFAGFRGDEFRPWLLAIVRNTAYRWLNQQKKYGNVISLDDALVGGDPAGHIVDPTFAADEPNAEDLLIQRADQNSVLKALSELPPVFREILVLREIEGLSYRSIAEITGTEIGTVMSRLSRARVELRKALSRRTERDEPSAM